MNVVYLASWIIAAVFVGIAVWYVMTAIGIIFNAILAGEGGPSRKKAKPLTPDERRRVEARQIVVNRWRADFGDDDAASAAIGAQRDRFKEQVEQTNDWLKRREKKRKPP